MPSQVPPIRLFHRELAKHFRFLADEFGFERAMDYQIEPRAMFQSEDLDLWIGHENGRYDAVFCLKRNVPWLLPYESKLFRVDDIARLLSEQEFRRNQELRSAGGMSSEQECLAMFEYVAGVLKGHCEPILRGDYQILQQVFARRKTVVQ